jgi:hypothetical protein
VEALALGEAGDGSGGGVAGADARDGVEVVADEFDVGVAPEGEEAGGV